MPSLGFTLVPTAWLRDPELPQGPKALLAYYLSHAEGYRCSVSQAAREQGVGRDTIGKQNARLVALGYLVSVEQTRGDRGRWGENDYAITTCTDRIPPRPLGDDLSDNPTLPGADLSSDTVPAITGTVGPGTVNPSLSRKALVDQETPSESRAAGSHLAAVPDGPTVDQRAQILAAEHYEGVGKLVPFLGIRGIVKAALAAGHGDDQIRAALGHLRRTNRTLTKNSLGLLLAGNGARPVGASGYGPSAPYRNSDRPGAYEGPL